MNEPKTKRPEGGKSGKPVVYVVGDEPMLLELASMILESLGCAVETFRSPDSALRAFKAAEPRPALIITDYAMHSMTGLDLAQACRRLRPEQKILLVSGTVGPEIFRDAPARPDRFLAKPYEAGQLSNAVKALLEG